MLMTIILMVHEINEYEYVKGKSINMKDKLLFMRVNANQNPSSNSFRPRNYGVIET